MPLPETHSQPGEREGWGWGGGRVEERGGVGRIERYSKE